MTAPELLAELTAKGIRIEPRPNGNLYLTPKDRVTPTLIDSIRQYKADLLAYLHAHDDS